MNRIAIFQAYQAFKFVLLSPNRINGVISRFSSKSFKYFPNPCDPTISPIFYPTQKCILEPLIFPNDLTIKSTGFNFLAYSIARYDHLQAILFCPLPTCGESPIGDLRTQSKKKISGTASSLQSL